MLETENVKSWPLTIQVKANGREITENERLSIMREIKIELC